MSRNSFANMTMTCLLIAGLQVLGSATNVAFAWQLLPTPATKTASDVIEIKNRVRGPWPILPIAPSYLAYDYPYYYNRGHYPTHIGGPGFVYSGLPYTYRAGRCSYWPAKSVRRAWIDARKCVGN